MPDSSPSGKKRKMTIVVGQKGVERAEKALKRLGFDSKSNFAESQRLSRSVVTKFFNQQPIQLDSFKRICEALELNWKEIAELHNEDKNVNWTEKQGESVLSINEGVEPVQTIARRVIPIDEQGQEIKTAAVILEGNINSVQTDLVFWREHFSKKYPGSTLKVTSIKPGSIKLIIEGTQKDIEMLLSDFESGNLTEIAGFPVEDAQLLSESAEDEESSKQKWRLVEEIVTKAWRGRDLSGADLSDADLRNSCLISANLSDADLSNSDLSRVDLSYADLSRADLSDANLSYADLSSAYLIRADLSGANLIGANLSDANLKRANLSGVDLSVAWVENAEFGGSLGISESTKQDLIKRGAIFEASVNNSYAVAESLIIVARSIGVIGSLGSVYASIHQIPDLNQFRESTESDKVEIKELLKQLQAAIEAETNLSDENKADALEQVKALAEAAKNPQEASTKKSAKRAMIILKRIVVSLPSVSILVEACTKLLPIIAKFLG